MKDDWDIAIMRGQGTIYAQLTIRHSYSYVLWQVPVDQPDDIKRMFLDTLAAFGKLRTTPEAELWFDLNR